MQKYITEFVGTFFLVLSVGLTGNALASGFMIVALVYLGGRISGAHYNPAVTVAFWAYRGMPSKTFWGYIGVQTVGALFAAGLIYYLAGFPFQAVPPPASSPVQYSIVELLFTFLLAITYLVVFITNKDKTDNSYGLIIGITYAGLLTIGEPISGGIFNPALAVGTSVIDVMNYGISYLYLPAYILAPLVGGIVAGLVFKYSVFSSQ